MLSSDLDSFLLLSHGAIAVAYALRVFVHAPLSTRRWLPIHDVKWWFPPGVTQVERAIFLLIVIEEDSLLSIMVLEVTAIHSGKGLLVNVRWYAARFSMMISDLKQ